MKCVVTTLNAKYIHQSLAVRLLYVANAERGVTFEEYTIKESPQKIAKSLLRNSPSVVGIGVYIWNVEQVGELVEELRERSPELVIVVGGPEVSYEPATFLERWQIDYVISGEGEFVLGELLEALAEGGSTEIDGVSSRGQISRHIARADVEQIAALPSPYALEQDVESLPHKVVYFETSRGCPYNCQYCLSSLEVGVRYMPDSYIFDNLRWLIEHGARTIKFLDRTFNLSSRHTLPVFNFLIENHRKGLSCQFEIYADILEPELIEYLNEQLPDDFFRFEIGIQSTHDPTNLAVKRHQDFDKLSSNIELIMAGGKIDLHLDLIAGLPYETFGLFRQSFNDVFRFRAKELQLGFLKLLRGTGLRKGAEEHGYVFQSHSPYEVISNNYLSAIEVERIKEVEGALDRFWNSGRFNRTMEQLFDEHYSGRYFEFFDQYGDYSRTHNLPRMGYQLEELFGWLYDFLQQQNIDLTNPMRLDYYSCFPQRPSKSFLPQMSKEVRHRVERTIAEDSEWLEQNGLTEYVVTKQSALDFAPQSTAEVVVTTFERDPHNPSVPTLTRELRYMLPDSTEQ